MKKLFFLVFLAFFCFSFSAVFAQSNSEKAAQIAKNVGKELKLRDDQVFHVKAAAEEYFNKVVAAQSEAKADQKKAKVFQASAKFKQKAQAHLTPEDAKKFGKWFDKNKPALEKWAVAQAKKK